MKKNVYLAGGFYAKVGDIDWQEYVTNIFYNGFEEGIVEVSGVKLLNPKEKEKHRVGVNDERYDIFKESYVHTTWDLQAIKSSNIVFAYIDKGNPAIGVVAEIGYAVGLGKPVILVTDPETEDSYHKDRYFNFLRNMPNVVHFTSIDNGVVYLQEVCSII